MFKNTSKNILKWPNPTYWDIRYYIIVKRIIAATKLFIALNLKFP